MTLVRSILIAAAMPLAVALVGCVPPVPTPVVKIPVSETLDAEGVVEGAFSPSAFAFAEDGRVFYTEKQTGRIRVIANGLLLDAPFATVPVNFAGDRGLNGIALHPNFAQNGRLYVFYSRADGGVSTNDPNAIIDNRVVYFVADGNTASGGEIFVASLPAAASTVRVGGTLAFDNDSRLLVGIGDIADIFGAQSATPLVGKVLRYDDAGGIPGDNPIADSPVLAIGFRDVQGLAIDPVTGDPFVTEQNENGFQEVNRIRGGRNYGWPAVIGFAKAPNELAFATATPTYTDPLFESSTDLVTMRGCAFNPGAKYGTDATNQLFFADPSGQQVFLVELNPGRTAATARPFLGPFPNPVTAVGFTSFGTMYVATESAIYKISPRS
ncbi:MAG: sorbosone dehydrogenase family protein [Phycisphaerae bacterium]